MKVRVKRPCFIDSRLREVGAEIPDLRADLFSAESMERLEEDAPEQAVEPGALEAKPEVSTETPRRRGRPPKQRTE